MDNELQFSRQFMPSTDKKRHGAQQVSEVLAAIMAHDGEIGTYTMAQNINDISYHRLKQISDRQLNDDNHCSALAKVVNAIKILCLQLLAQSRF